LIGELCNGTRKSGRVEANELIFNTNLWGDLSVLDAKGFDFIKECNNSLLALDGKIEQTHRNCPNLLRKLA